MNPWSLSLCETAKERFDGPDDGEEEVVELSVLLYCDVVPHSAILPKISYYQLLLLDVSTLSK